MRRRITQADDVSSAWNAELWSSEAFDHGDLSRQRRRWSIVAAVLLTGGIVGSTVMAHTVATNDAERSRQDFDRASTEVVSTLQLAIQHQDDLVINASGLVAADSTPSEIEFGNWAALTDVFDRYPEVSGFGYAVIVPTDELDDFIERARLERPEQFAPDGAFDLLPPGDRPQYCLTELQLNRAGTGTPIGTDWCADGGVGVRSRDSGDTTYTPVSIGGEQLLSVRVPVYRLGMSLGSVQERRRAFTGWVATVSTPSVLLELATRSNPTMTVSMRYRENSSDVVFSNAPTETGSATATFDLDNGWTISTSRPIHDSGMLGNLRSLLVLITMALLSAAVAALVLVLGTGQARAVRLVANRTGELQHRALHDELTGLPNRALIMDRVAQLLVRTRRIGSIPAALYIDIDDFKNVNDSLGELAGDRLLIAVADRLSSVLRAADTLGRMGGDEFVVLLDGAHIAGGQIVHTDPELVAERLLAVMHQPFELEEISAILDVSISVGVADGDRATGSELLRDANIALYEAKAGGKNRYDLFDQQMHTDSSRETELEFDLRSALEGHQFRLMYQPIYQLNDLRIVGIEALLRWDHPTLGTISPVEFIPILEQTGRIQAVGDWVLRTACEQTASWNTRGHALTISVNVSARQLDHDLIVDQVADALHTTGLAPTALVVEVTETALMRDPDATATRLRSIRKLGVRIAVDDFGTGYSSLAYLQRFPIDCLKIDRAFTNAITTSPGSKALIRTLVQLGKDLGLTTIAEGVETEAQMEHLRREHVDAAQGFLFSRPLDVAQIDTKLSEPTHARIPAPASS